MADKDETYGRRITDPQAVRALAHAGRYAILERLQLHGPATATECAEVAGLSPSACSYHLRLLAKYGFVEEADNPGGDGRERLWRAVVTGWQSDLEDEADSREAAALDQALGRIMLDSSDRKVLAWLDGAAGDSRRWREAAVLSNSTLVATAAELEQIKEALMAVLRPYFLSRRPLEDAPDGARLLHAALRVVPRTG
ncbi:MAG TPA: helix-turn-helix domain-containing protein [Actinomycetes bacterium]